MSIFELHNYLIYEGIICQLKEVIDNATGKPLMSNTALLVIMPYNIRKTTDRYKQMCGCKICVLICYTTKRKKNTLTMMCLCFHLMKRIKKAARVKMRIIKNTN